MQLTKLCSKCGILKPFSNYSKSSKGKYGLMAHCKACDKLRKDLIKNDQLLNEKELDRAKAYRLNNKERVKEANRSYWYNVRKNNPLEKIKAKERLAKYYENNKDSYKLKKSTYKSANRHVYNCLNAKRRASKLQATIDYGEFDTFLIQEVYSLASLKSTLTGVKYSVDHIIPLQHPLVCGLHVGVNLKVIPLLENIKKGNKFND